MTGDDTFPEPSPVAEYRDPELVRRFESELVPQHGAGFWAEVEARLGAGRVDETDDLLLDATPIDLVPTATSSPRLGVGRLLSVAAALAVIGVGGAVLVAQSRSGSPVESAAPLLTPEPDAVADDTEPGSSPTSTTVVTTTTAPPTSAATGPSSTVAATPDYFGDEVRVDRIGPGQVVGFSPDDSAILVVDDGPGVARGCEGAELLALYRQDLASGQRRPAIDGAPAIETGGVDLAISPFQSTPGEVGTRPVYGQEWCDGVTASLWRGVMAADGRISQVQPVEAGGPDDPFAAEPAGTSGGELGPGPGQRARLSPDGKHVLVLSSSNASVAEIGTEAGRNGKVVGVLPDDLDVAAVTSGIWAPAGDAVAIGTADSVILWSPWTGAHQRFDSGPVRRLVFDNAGGRLIMVSSDATVPDSVLTFGDRPAPTPAPPRCSGRFGFSPLSAAMLADEGLPKDVVTTALAIDQAASQCDWSGLERLTPEEFVASFGGGDPVELWRQAEAYGESPMWYLRTLLRQPHVADDDEDPAFHIWPSIQQDDECRLSDAERASVIALGADPETVEDECAVVGGYAGYRTIIDDDGEWRVFVAGD